jgi:Uma2 family endonuclease
MGTKTALTWEQFLAAGKEGQRWEYIDGEVRFMSPTGSRHGWVIHLIGKALSRWEDVAGDWVCFGADVAFTMADGSWLCPDAAVVWRERYPGGVIPEGPTPFPPDVAFEVRSPGDKASDVEKKRYVYYNKVTQVWVDPEAETVEVVSPNRPTRYFGRGETVVIEELPGFRMDLFPLLSDGVEESRL